jgi:hypothetical protein
MAPSHPEPATKREREDRRRWKQIAADVIEVLLEIARRGLGL